MTRACKGMFYCPESETGDLPSRGGIRCHKTKTLPTRQRGDSPRKPQWSVGHGSGGREGGCLDLETWPKKGARGGGKVWGSAAAPGVRDTVRIDPMRMQQRLQMLAVGGDGGGDDGWWREMERGWDWCCNLMGLYWFNLPCHLFGVCPPPRPHAQTHVDGVFVRHWRVHGPCY